MIETLKAVIKKRGAVIMTYNGGRLLFVPLCIGTLFNGATYVSGYEVTNWDGTENVHYEKYRQKPGYTSTFLLKSLNTAHIQAVKDTNEWYPASWYYDYDAITKPFETIHIKANT